MIKCCCVHACAQSWQCICYICTSRSPGLTRGPSDLASMHPAGSITSKLDTVFTQLSSTLPAYLVHCPFTITSICYWFCFVIVIVVIVIIINVIMIIFTIMTIITTWLGLLPASTGGMSSSESNPVVSSDPTLPWSSWSMRRISGSPRPSSSSSSSAKSQAYTLTQLHCKSAWQHIVTATKAHSISTQTAVLQSSCCQSMGYTRLIVAKLSMQHC